MAEENEKGEEPKEKKGSTLMFVIIGATVLILAGGGFVAWQLLSAQKNGRCRPGSGLLGWSG